MDRSYHCRSSNSEEVGGLDKIKDKTNHFYFIYILYAPA